LKEKDKAYQYAVQPYLDSCEISKLNVITMDKDTDLAFLSKHTNLVQFNNQKILILDQSTGQKRFPDKFKIDYIYITGNPNANLVYLKQNYNFKLLIADGSNSTRRSNQMEREAIAANINFISVKRNKSLILASNH